MINVNITLKETKAGKIIESIVDGKGSEYVNLHSEFGRILEESNYNSNAAYPFLRRAFIANRRNPPSDSDYIQFNIVRNKDKDEEITING